MTLAGRILADNETAATLDEEHPMVVMAQMAAVVPSQGRKEATSGKKGKQRKRGQTAEAHSERRELERCCDCLSPCDPGSDTNPGPAPN